LRFSSAFNRCLNRPSSKAVDRSSSKPQHGRPALPAPAATCIYRYCSLQEVTRANPGSVVVPRMTYSVVGRARCFIEAIPAACSRCADRLQVCRVLRTDAHSKQDLWAHDKGTDKWIRIPDAINDILSTV